MNFQLVPVPKGIAITSRKRIDMSFRSRSDYILAYNFLSGSRLGAVEWAARRNRALIIDFRGPGF